MYTLKTAKQHVIRKKILLITFSIMLLIGIKIYYNSDAVTMNFDPMDNNISCHYMWDGDALPAAEDPDFSPQSNSIFFHETSCRGKLNSRQACAVESAARAHPSQQIYVLFSAPISHHTLTKTSLANLRNIPNINLARVHIYEYAKNTPLEEMLASDPFNESQWRVEHTSDVLRSLTLYKFGGVYLDTDMLVVKPLTPLGHNWVGKEDGALVNGAAIAMSLDHIGRKLSDGIINELKTTYRPDIWEYNGPGAITRVLERICHPASFANWSSDTCQGFKVYEPEYFYPIYYTTPAVYSYFKPGDLEDREKTYMHHLWNKITKNFEVEKGSPYQRMAKEYCPTIYEMYGDQFGT